MNSNANFMLPGFYEHYDLYVIILHIIKDHPEFLHEKSNIYCLYGNIPFCTWDGGRIFNSYQSATMEQMQHIQNVYNDIFNIKIRFVFTNGLLTEEDCYDRYNNIALSIFHSDKNEIVVNSPVLENYIIKNYPKYNLISSTTKCITNIEEVKQELNKEQYKLICLDYNLNHNQKLLDNLTEQEKEKVELLVNPICGPGCPHRKEHYRLNSLFSLTYGKKYNLRNCTIEEGIFYPVNWPTVIQPEELYTSYVNKGFKYFKLEGRTLSDLDNLLTFTKYLIKPEYQYHFISLASNQLFK